MTDITNKQKLWQSRKYKWYNKGAGGVDGIELNELYEYINKNWNSINRYCDIF